MRVRSVMRSIGSLCDLYGLGFVICCQFYQERGLRSMTDWLLFTASHALSLDNSGALVDGSSHGKDNYRPRDGRHQWRC